jgi:hypothetical protein
MVQLGGRFGLLDHGCAFFASISPTGDYGPTKFIKDAHAKHQSFNPDHVQADKGEYGAIFECMVDTLRHGGFKNTEPIAVEQVGCAGSRQQRNRLKKEFVFEEPCTGRIQLLMHPFHEKEGETVHCYYDFDSGEWRDFFLATGMLPAFSLFELSDFEDYTQEARLLTELRCSNKNGIRLPGCSNKSGIRLPTMPLPEQIPMGVNSVFI